MEQLREVDFYKTDKEVEYSHSAIEFILGIESITFGFMRNGKEKYAHYSCLIALPCIMSGIKWILFLSPDTPMALQSFLSYRC